MHVHACHRSEISQHPSLICLYSPENGTTQLERVNIALVTSDGQGSEAYDFKYFPEQNDTNTWQSKLNYIHAVQVHR